MSANIDPNQIPNVKELKMADIQASQEESLKNGEIVVKQRFGPFKLKDMPNRQGFSISNKAENEPYLIVKEIVFRKVPGENNKIEVLLLMPDPDRVEVVGKEKQ